MTEGIKFSVVDLKVAYLQLEVCEESRDLRVISTHVGYFSYKRLLFVISYFPQIFQRFMESLIEGIKHVACLLDDIITTGESDKER